jgi:hypothetical protein
MSSPLAAAIASLHSKDASARFAAATEIYRAGRELADQAVSSWWGNPELSQLLFWPEPQVTIGLAVERATFASIHDANGAPPLAHVPPDQDVEEFELHFPDRISLDVLTTRAPGGPGAIARYLAKFGEGIQQVEFCCRNVDQATGLLKQAFGIVPVYPNTRAGADGTRVNFFLVPALGAGNVLIELYESAGILY